MVLTRDEIILKYWNSVKLKDKIDALLNRCGVSRHTRIIEDCISRTFLELSRMPAEKIEYLYNVVQKQKFEGYIMNMCKNACIKLSNANPKGCEVQSIYHASSLHCGASISPTNVLTQSPEDENYFNPANLDDNPYTQNKIFEYLLQYLDAEEIEILNLLVDKKKTKGRYTSIIKQQVEALKIKIKTLVNEYTEDYQFNKRERKFKSNQEIDELINPPPVKNNRNKDKKEWNEKN